MIKVVVVGLGYVGLPLAKEAVSSGIEVLGFDISDEVARGLNSAESHVDDITKADLERMLNSGFRVSNDPSIMSGADYIVVCVPTPLSEDGGPDLSAVRGSMSTIQREMTPGVTVILESTTYPGTTDEIVKPILDRSGLTIDEDYFLAFSPERIDPGNALYGAKNTPKVVGGYSPRSGLKAAAFYEQFIDQVKVVSGTREAEMTKLLENTYRHVNIALVNEMAKFCHDLQINFWEAIEAAKTKPFGFQEFRPGPGVGGHCIPIDPNYLSFNVKKQLGYTFQFVELAQNINASMPAYVVGRVQDALNGHSKPLNGARILLLGITYKADIADQRESPAVAVAEGLFAKGAQVVYHDPFVAEWTAISKPMKGTADLARELERCDFAVLLQAHSSYDLEEIAASGAKILDTRGVLPASDSVELL